MLGGEFLGFELAFRAAGAYQYDVGAKGGSCLALDGGRVIGHDDDGFHAEGAGGVGDALRVIAAGVGDDAALSFFFGEGCDLVIGSAQFEGADGLLVFGLQEEAAVGVGEGDSHVSQRRGDMGHPRFRRCGIEFDQGRAGGDALEAGAGGVDVVESDHWPDCSLDGFNCLRHRVTLMAEFWPAGVRFLSVDGD